MTSKITIAASDELDGLAAKSPASQRMTVIAAYRAGALTPEMIEEMGVIAASYRGHSHHAEDPRNGTSMCARCGDVGDAANERVDLYWHPELISGIVR